MTLGMQLTPAAQNKEPASIEPANLITFKTSQGLEVQATVLRVGPHAVAFEVYSARSVLRLSEVLIDFTIEGQTHAIYRGRATLTGILTSGAVSVCEATLADSLMDLDLFQLQKAENYLKRDFRNFLSRWQKFYKVSPEYKLAVADLTNFLQELRLWLDQVELAIRGLPNGDRREVERRILEELIEPVTPAVITLFERFEIAAAAVPHDLAPVHVKFCRHQLHPLLMSSPFMYRIFVKPLGYAGDYEMVDMILRDPCEGGSLFAKLLNIFILREAPAEAHRNRVKHLVKTLINEGQRLSQLGRGLRVFNIGCGPAGEVQQFLSEQHLSNHSQFTLLDSNDETLRNTGNVLQSLATKFNRTTSIRLFKKSVQQLIKESARPSAGREEYDLVYSAGLFDYLNDRVCTMIIQLGYELLAPGGLLLVTNVDASNPIRNIMEHLYEWYLVYRTGDQLGSLANSLPPGAVCKVHAELTSTNLFLEIRKPLSNT
jgi:extracellular factor (EF) 3-hydroxypalmitic acid methyl ester biosynthesis protein